VTGNHPAGLQVGCPLQAASESSVRATSATPKQNRLRAILAARKSVRYSRGIVEGRLTVVANPSDLRAWSRSIAALSQLRALGVKSYAVDSGCGRMRDAA
jgi:hypothetical protein